MKKTFRGTVTEMRESENGSRATAIVKVDEHMVVAIHSTAEDPEDPDAHKVFDEFDFKKGDKVSVRLDLKG